jgi:hypothetical protein
MKKIITLIVLLISGLSFAQTGAKIDFSTSTIDYGKISTNDNGVRVFEFTNTGDTALVITSIQSTGSCTILSKTMTILPGEKGKIEIKYNMSLGPIRKTITVESNAVNYNEGRFALKIKGEVI